MCAQSIENDAKFGSRVLWGQFAPTYRPPVRARWPLVCSTFEAAHWTFYLLVDVFVIYLQECCHRTFVLLLEKTGARGGQRARI